MSGFTVYQDTTSNGGDKITSTWNPFPTQLTGSNVKDAGKKTDAATTDKTISPNSGFNCIRIINDGANELRLCVDGDSTAGASIIYVYPGETFEDQIKGSVLHYSVASGSTTFRYVLR